MNLLKHFRILCAVAIVAIGPLAYGQDGDDEIAGTRYQVELLIFRYGDQTRSTQEIARPPAAQIDDILEQDLARIDAGNLSNQGDNNFNQPYSPSITLVGGDKKLSSDADRLRRLGAYEVLGHIAWIQSVENVADAKPVNLSELGFNSSQLSGTVNFFQRKYLHLALDVALGSNNPYSITLSDKDRPAIRESRRVRLNNLNYFDQPQFGIIAIVSRSN